MGRRLLRADVRDVHAHGRQARGLLRPAPALHHRPGDLHARVARLRARAERRLPHRRPRRAGPRRGDHEPGDARDHHRDVPASSAGDGDRHLGRRLGDGARHRPAARRADHRPHRLELDLLRQRPGRRARHHRRPLGDRREPRHLARAASRPAGAGDVGGRPLRAHVRADRGQLVRLDVAAHPRDLRRRRDRAGGVRPARAAPARADARPDALPGLDVHRGEPHDAARLAGDVRHLLLQLALPPERPRLLGHADGRGLPADDRADHPRRALGRPLLGQGGLEMARRQPA